MIYLEMMKKKKTQIVLFAFLKKIFTYLIQMHFFSLPEFLVQLFK